jgi:AcrR family transcriptional regulator
VDQIAADAGYTKGAFYANFKGKEELFLVMLDEKYADELQRLEWDLAGELAPGEEARQAAEGFIRLALSDPQWPKLYFEFTAYASRNPEFREELAARDQAMRERIIEVFKRWSADFPAEPPFPYEDLAMMIFCMANGFLMGKLIEPELSEELYGTMMATFFLGSAAAATGFDLEALTQLQEARSRKAGAGR